MHHASQPTEGTLVMAPVSPALAKLLHQLQAQIIREADEGRPRAALTLPPDGAVRYTRASHRETGGFRVVECDGAGNGLHLQTPLVGDPERPWQRPGKWYGNETRVDSSGRTWKRTLQDDYVTDDFGTLIPVSETLE